MCWGVEGHFVVFSLYTCLVLASDTPPQQPPHPPSKRWPQRPEDKTEQWLRPCRHHLQVGVNVPRQSGKEEGAWDWARSFMAPFIQNKQRQHSGPVKQ